MRAIIFFVLSNYALSFLVLGFIPRRLRYPARAKMPRDRN